MNKYVNGYKKEEIKIHVHGRRKLGIKKEYGCEWIKRKINVYG